MADNSETMNLAELIVPCTFELSDAIAYTPAEVKQMTDYDREHLHECKDMLELILRAKSNNSEFCTFTKFASAPIDQIKRYKLLVEWIISENACSREDSVLELDPKTIKLVPATGRLADFCELVIHDDFRYVFAAKDASSGDFHLVMEIDFKTVSLCKINRWQAQYITIRGAISILGEKAKVNGTVEQLREIFKLNTFIHTMQKVPFNSPIRNTPDDSDYDVFCKLFGIKSAKTAEKLIKNYNAEVNIADKNNNINETPVEVKVADENDVTNVKTTEQTIKNDTAEVETVEFPHAEEPVKYHCRFLDFKETYEKLFRRGDAGLFTSEPVKKAKILSVKDLDTVVKLDGENTATLRTNVKYSGTQSQKDIASDVIDCVKSIPLCGDLRNFAYTGFRFGDTLYQIENVGYKNMYSYIIQKGNDLSMIPKDLVKSAIDIKNEVANLPEIDFCKDATVSIDDKITIRHGENTIRTYIADDPTLFARTYYQYVKSRPVVGKFNGKMHLFLKIGIRRYKIMEISDVYAAELFVNDPDMYV